MTGDIEIRKSAECLIPGKKSGNDSIDLGWKRLDGLADVRNQLCCLRYSAVERRHTIDTSSCASLVSSSALRVVMDMLSDAVAVESRL